MCTVLFLSGCKNKDTSTVADNESVPSVGTDSRVGLGNSNNQESDNDDSSEKDDILAAPESEEYSDRVLNLSEPLVENQDQSVTVMVYMVGSDLESKSGAATLDLQEMADSGIDLSKNNVVIYTGGCEKWFNDISAETNNIYQLTDNGLVKVKEYKSSSMGNPSNLSEFLNFTYKNYKTDSYNLILWDHGNGPVLGYGKDRLYENDSLLLSEIDTALKKSPFGKNNKLGFIGFDACLMSSAELACTISDYAEYMVASQEVEPNFGWNYAFLHECGNVSNASLARLAVYNYVKYCDDYFSENENFCSDVTMACIDLQYADELKSKINELFDEAINDVSGSYNLLALERFNTKAFGRATTGYEYDLVDIYSLMNAMGEKYDGKTSEVKTLINNMVNFSADNTKDCCGMSIYYPYFNKKQYEKSWKEDYKKVSQFASYQKYLDSFAQIWMGTDMMSLFTEPLSPEEYEPGSYSLKLSEEQLSCYLSSGYYILRKEGDGVFSVASYSRDVSMEDGVLNAMFDGKSLMICDDFGRKSMIASEVTDVVSDDYYHSIDIIAKDRMYVDVHGTVPYATVNGEIHLVVDHESNRVEVEGIYELTEEESKADSIKTGKMAPLNMDAMKVLEFAQRVPMYPLRDDNGVLLPIEEWLPTSIVSRDVYSIENGIHFTYEPIYDDGYEYFLMFDVMDTQAHHYSSELMPIKMAKGEKVSTQIREANYSWIDPEKSPEITNAGITITLFENKDIGNNNSDIYGLYLTNNNDCQVQVEIKDVLVNDKYEMGISNSVTIFAGHQGAVGFAGLERILRYSGNNRLENIRFSYRISDYITGKIISDWSCANIEIGEKIIPHVQAMNICGASASEQIICDNEKLKIELLDGGFYPGAKVSNMGIDTFGCRMVINNKTDDIIEIDLNTIRVNGIVVYVDMYESVFDGGDHGTIAILPGEDKYVFLRSVGIYNGIEYKSIYSVELVALLNESGSYDRERICLPIKLNDVQENSIASIEEGHSCVYSDENIDIYDMGSQTSGVYSTTPIYRSLMVVNKTSGRIDIAPESILMEMQEDCDYIVEKEPYLTSARLMEGDRVIMSIDPEKGMTGEAFSVIFNITSYAADADGKTEYITPQLVLEKENN